MAVTQSGPLRRLDARVRSSAKTGRSFGGAWRQCTCSASSAGIRSLRRDKLPDARYQEVFGVDLLGSGKLTEQALTADDSSQMVTAEVKRPMGMVLAERRVLNGAECVVDELLPDSNALAAGVRVGDILRLTTCVVEVRGKVDTFSFYSNPPAAKMRRAVLVADKQPFGKVMKAIASNAEAVDLPDGSARPFDAVCLVFERKANAQ